MNIVHICMCDAYAEKWTYHRNIISERNAKDGHNVSLITTVFTMDQFGKRKRVSASDTVNEVGVRVIRLNNKLTNNVTLQSRLRYVKGLYNALTELNPDLIMVHNPQFLSMNEVTRYKRNNNCVLLVDSHADYQVSARNFASRYMLNGILYRRIVRANLDYVDKLYFITSEGKKFFTDLYTKTLPENCIIPLSSKYYDAEEKSNLKRKIRAELGLKDEILLLHSGKLDPRKNTLTLLKAFSSVPDLNAVLVICGSIPEDNKQTLMPLIEHDSRVKYLGWKSSYELSEFLCAADLYLQPGMHSVTLQNALSCGTPSLVAPHSGYDEFYDKWQIVCSQRDELVTVFQNLMKEKYDFEAMSQSAYRIAKKHFDISIFAEDMYETYEKRRCEK